MIYSKNITRMTYFSTCYWMPRKYIVRKISENLSGKSRKKYICVKNHMEKKWDEWYIWPWGSDNVYIFDFCWDFLRSYYINILLFNISLYWSHFEANLVTDRVLPRIRRKMSLKKCKLNKDFLHIFYQFFLAHLMIFQSFASPELHFEKSSKMLKYFIMGFCNK